VTIAKRPSDGTGRLSSIAVSTEPPNENFLPEGLDTAGAAGRGDLPVGQVGRDQGCPARACIDFPTKDCIEF